MPTSATTRVVGITSVDLANRKAEGMTRTHVSVRIDLSYHVGASIITPAVGEQWLIERADVGYYRLTTKLQTNAPDLLTDAVPGQVHVGSSGPLELNGSVVNLNAPVSVAAYSTDMLPPAGSVPAGGHVYDTTIGKPVWSDGTNWRDAAGQIPPELVRIRVFTHGRGRLAATALAIKAVVDTPISGHGALACAAFARFASTVAVSGQGVLSPTAHPLAVGHLRGVGVMKAVAGQRGLGSCAGVGSLSAAARMYRINESGATIGQGALSAKIAEKMPASVLGRGVLSAIGFVKTSRSVALDGRGTVSAVTRPKPVTLVGGRGVLTATTVPNPGFLSAGAGVTNDAGQTGTSHTVSWTDTVPATAAAAVVCGNWWNDSTNGNTTPTFACSVGGTQVSADANHFFNTTGGFPTHYYDGYLFIGVVLNPPTGSQTVSVTSTTVNSNTQVMKAKAFYYQHVSSIGTPVHAGMGGGTSTGTGLSLTIPSSVNQVVVCIFDGQISGGSSTTLTLTGPTGVVTRYNTGADGAPIIVGQAAGAASVVFAGTASPAATWGGIGVTLLP